MLDEPCRRTVPVMPACQRASSTEPRATEPCEKEWMELNGWISGSPEWGTFPSWVLLSVEYVSAQTRTNVLSRETGLYSIEADNPQGRLDSWLGELTSGLWHGLSEHQSMTGRRDDPTQNTQTLLRCTVFCLLSSWVLSLPPAVCLPREISPFPLAYTHSYLRFWG